LFSLVAAFAQSVEGRRLFDLGVGAFEQDRYNEAALYFRKAVQADPRFKDARLYLARTFMVQYTPIADFEENTLLGKQAHEAYIAVLELDPESTEARASISLLEGNLDEAVQRYQKLIAAAPKRKEAYHALSVVIWTRAFRARMEVRARLGMRPDEPGPIPDSIARQELKTKNLLAVQEGIESLRVALTLDPEYDDAMAYMHLLVRERADLADDREGYRRDAEAADKWLEQALPAKRARATRAAPAR
jgi:tetratricopeptide (TPR) repeat protein